MYHSRFWNLLAWIEYSLHLDTPCQVYVHCALRNQQFRFKSRLVCLHVFLNMQAKCTFNFQFSISQTYVRTLMWRIIHGRSISIESIKIFHKTKWCCPLSFSLRMSAYAGPTSKAFITIIIIDSCPTKQNTNLIFSIRSHSIIPFYCQTAISLFSYNNIAAAVVVIMVVVANCVVHGTMSSQAIRSKCQRKPLDYRSILVMLLCVIIINKQSE